MKSSLLFGAILSIAAFAGVTNAQQTRLIFGSDHGIWRDAGGVYTLFASRTVGTIVAPPGRAIRVRFAQVSNQGRITSIAVDPTDPTVVYQVPCDGKKSAIEQARNGLPNVPVKDLQLDQGIELMSSSAWKGTCRMFKFKLVDGSVRSLKVSFE